MKKVFCLLLFLSTLTSFSQAITVSTDKSIDDLVNNVLINSPCISTEAIKSSTGTKVGSNGIGYFENTNPNFPMKSGVILSTGNALKAVGPNDTNTVLSDGSNEWDGDKDLEDAMEKAGIKMKNKSKNATVLEFDFIPISSKFSFDFLFASEEYGNYQCDFSDAFAFLLTNNATKETTNLAVVPNTTTPISVVTIRNKKYNSNCDNQNVTYFGRYNGGTGASSSATNFNGTTVVLNASATLEINQTYHIKLVIADRDDFKNDSAIFLASDSFNIGQNVLGEDVTMSNGKAPCYNTPYVIDSELDPQEYYISWYNQDGNIITAGEQKSTLTITNSGKYTVSYQKKSAGCSRIKDEILVEYRPIPVVNNPIDLYKCNGGGSPYSFDLSLNTNRLKNGLDPLTTVSYHKSLIEANSNTNSLTTSYSTTNVSETIFASIKVPGNDCYVVKDFKLSAINPPVVNPPADLSECSEENTFDFDLTLQDAVILNTVPTGIFKVKYFNSQVDANTGQNRIMTTDKYNSAGEIIFARIENKTDSSCFSTTSFNLKIKAKPLVDLKEKVETCGQFELPPLVNGKYYTALPENGGIPLISNIIDATQEVYIYNYDATTGCQASSSFNVKILPDDFKFPDIKGPFCGSYDLLPLDIGDFYTEDDGQGTLLPSGTSLKTSQTIYAYFKSKIDPLCIKKRTFNIVVNAEIELVDVEDVYECYEYILPTLNAGEYFTATNGGGTKITGANTTIRNNQKIFIYANTPKNCPTEKSFNVIIGLDLIDISQCKPYTLPILPIGVYYTAPGGPNGTGIIMPPETLIEVSQKIYVYLPLTTSPDCSNEIIFNVNIEKPIVDKLDDITVCGSFPLPGLTYDGNYFTASGGTGTPLHAKHEIKSTQTIYIYYSREEGCSNESSFTVTVIPKPEIESGVSNDNCNSSYLLTDLEIGRYYTNSHYNNSNPIEIPFGTTLTESQTVFIYAESPTDSGCSAENSFEIKINNIEIDTSEIKNIISYYDYKLPALKVGNYYTDTHAGSGNPILIPYATTIITSQKIFIYAESGTRINCTDEKSFTVTIVEKPVIGISQITFCDEDGINDGKTLFDLSKLNSNVLGTQTSSEFKIEYFATQSDAAQGNNPIITTDLKRVYTKITNTSSINECIAIGSIDININKIPEPKPVGGVICFDNNTNIPINSYTIESGLSNTLFTFEWQSENGTIVGTDNKYEAILPGVYTVMATDKRLTDACSSARIPVSVIASEIANISYTIPDDFTNEPSITVVTDGVGNYEYQLDKGPFQNNAVFNNVISGTHNITVRDINGCGNSSAEVIIINYPKFFTPNNDGFNETWNISDLIGYNNTTVHIYDRYGKLITKITPNTKGWDGNFNGLQLPSSDYWFVVSYEKEGVQKIFKSHFSLKR